MAYSENADVIIIEANYDRTSSYGKGSNKAPKAIKKIFDNQIEIYERITGLNPAEDLRIEFQDLGDLNTLSPEKMVSKIKKVFKNLYKKNKFIITLGGEHSITNGPLEAISELSKSSDITVVQIDAHFDLRPDDSDYSPRPWGKYKNLSW
ncbi:arginase family protein [Candidatus Woesearchaeota archaeon]|nr:arginase family protein [Candidatus Woesearchaeota archaeon]